MIKLSYKHNVTIFNSSNYTDIEIFCCFNLCKIISNDAKQLEVRGFNKLKSVICPHLTDLFLHFCEFVNLDECTKIKTITFYKSYSMQILYRPIMERIEIVRSHNINIITNNINLRNNELKLLHINNTNNLHDVLTVDNIIINMYIASMIIQRRIKKYIKLRNLCTFIAILAELYLHPDSPFIRYKFNNKHKKGFFMIYINSANMPIFWKIKN